MESNTTNISSAYLHIVLISVNAVLRLLKRSTCVGGRTHLVVVAISRFDFDAARLWLVIIIIQFIKRLRPWLQRLFKDCKTCEME